MLDMYLLLMFIAVICGTIGIGSLIQFAIIYYFKGRHAAIKFLKEEF
jgi:hypothetical protein